MAALYFQAIPALWIAWLIYWIAAAAGARKTRRREPLWSRLSYTLPTALGFILLVRERPPWGALSPRMLPNTLAVYPFGVALVALGLAFAVWAHRHLADLWSGTVTLKAGHELIRSVPTRLGAAPIYSGLLLAVPGSAVARGDLKGALHSPSSRWRSCASSASRSGGFLRNFPSNMPAIGARWRR